VCLSASISPKLRVRYPPISVRVIHSRGSVLHWRRCDTLCASGFMDDVIFAHHGREWLTDEMAAYSESDSACGSGVCRRRRRTGGAVCTAACARRRFIAVTRPIQYAKHRSTFRVPLTVAVTWSLSRGWSLCSSRRRSCSAPTTPSVVRRRSRPSCDEIPAE